MFIRIFKYLVLILAPIMLFVVLVRSFNGLEFKGISNLIDYIETFPIDDLETLRNIVSTVGSVGFKSADWSGGFVSDVLEGVKALTQYIAWFFNSLYSLFNFVLGILLWALNFPNWLLLK